jgi:hypothetical protein
MHSYFAAAALLIALVSIFIVRHLQHVGHYGIDAISSLRKLPLDKLCMVVPTTANAQELISDDDLWATIGGRKGLMAIQQNIRIFVEILSWLETHDPQLQAETEEMQRKAAMAMICVLFGYLESPISSMIPDFPRMHARFAAQLYCETAIRVETICGDYPDVLTRITDALMCTT